MSSLDHRQDSTTEQYVHTSPLLVPGSVTQDLPVEQLPFPTYSVKFGTSQPAAKPALMRRLDDPLAGSDALDLGGDSTSLPTMTQSLMVPPRATRALNEVQTDALASVSLPRTTTTLRHPVVIRGTGKKSISHIPPKSRRHPVMHLAVTGVLALIVLSALFAVLPVGGSQNSLFKMITGNGHMDITNMRANNTGLIEQQAATATAVTTDGYDNGPMNVVGVPTPPPNVSGNMGGSPGGIVSSNVGTLGNFFYGQCTYWANLRYHQLTGFWVPWHGNAQDWYGGAIGSGWRVSPTPNPNGPSIIVLQAYVQLAGALGHVAVVERILGNGVVSTSNQNWAGNWGRTTYVNFNYPAAGVAFAWHP